eukprot:CAMPEP_0185264716 /NCGR_PEP_ID=MMETSP1359-20130426/24487_1 /TAXON_ID=552665 /ORGANISM="Bigelowiella longifila, Strain CCMP242" /LENGTH=142 /DNA_ID=CAMNT_0027853485 /DNA_START=356 /DNA_END=784 /DNA_ORIENTATION=-
MSHAVVGATSGEEGLDQNNATKASLQENKAATSGSGTKPLPALPAPDPNKNMSEISIGQSKSFYEEMGPLVINEDGTTGYLTNWKEMTDHEKKAVVRILMKRNRIRYANLTGETAHLSQDELKRLRDKQADTTDPNNPLAGL